MSTQGSAASAPDWITREEPAINYARQWRVIATRWYTALFLLITWPPLCVGLFLYSRATLHMPLTCLSIMGLWLAGALSAVWWAGESRCPRCRRRYAALGHKPGDTNYTRGFFATVCSNCKLRKYENG